MNLIKCQVVRVVVVFALSASCWTGTVRAGEVGADDSARNVVFVTIDGLRWQEVFGGAQEKYIDIQAGGVQDMPGLRQRFGTGATPEARRADLMPFFWSVIAKKGQVFGDATHGGRARVTNGKNFSYPGYSEMLCGMADARIDSNAKVPNPNVNVLEWLNSRPAFRGRVSAYGTWDVLPSILNVQRSGLPVVAGWEPVRDEPLTDGERAANALVADLPRLWRNNVFDAVTGRLAMEHLRKRKPRVFYIAFGETDEWAHMRRYDCYLESAHANDRYLQELWETLESMPEYAGKTSLVVTTDHGRGGTLKDWTDHNKDTPGCEDIWIAVMGPDTPALGVREGVEVTQSQVAATLALLAGEDVAAFAKDSPNAAAPLPVREGKGATK
jgi:hypothetical protein